MQQQMERCKAEYGGDLRTSGGQLHKHWADLLLHKSVDGVNDESLHSCPAAKKSVHHSLHICMGCVFAAPESFSFGRRS